MKKTSANYYRRHKRGCRAGHSEDSRSGEFEERKKGWKQCDCPISASGTINGRFLRKSLGAISWDDARSLIESLPDWTEVPRISPTVAVIPASPQRITIAKAVKAYEKHHEASKLNTQMTYSYLMASVSDFMVARGYLFLDQITPLDIRDMRYSWTVSAKSARQKLVWIKGFFKFCRANEWIKENPAELIKGPRANASTEEKPRIPFSDKELDKMFAACQDNGQPRKFKGFNGQDLSDFISISMYTGLRISDVVTFNVDRVKDNGDIRIRATKNGEPVYTWVPEWITARIRARAEQHGEFIFGKQYVNFNVTTKRWRHRLNVLWALCGEWTVDPVPHRFRHTFARILLQNGVPVAQVAELLGDTEEVIRKHYAAWVPERQDRLRRILQEAFEDKPAPGKVVAFPSR